MRIADQIDAKLARIPANMVLCIRLGPGAYSQFLRERFADEIPTDGPRPLPTKYSGHRLEMSSALDSMAIVIETP